jgi:hypothetical protein
LNQWIIGLHLGESSGITKKLSGFLGSEQVGQSNDQFFSQEFHRSPCISTDRLLSVSDDPPGPRLTKSLKKTWHHWNLGSFDGFAKCFLLMEDFL